jgi:hypothetical protein
VILEKSTSFFGHTSRIDGVFRCPSTMENSNCEMGDALLINQGRYPTWHCLDCLSLTPFLSAKPDTSDHPAKVAFLHNPISSHWFSNPVLAIVLVSLLLRMEKVSDAFAQPESRNVGNDWPSNIAQMTVTVICGRATERRPLDFLGVPTKKRDLPRPYPIAQVEFVTAACQKYRWLFVSPRLTSNTH